MRGFREFRPSLPWTFASVYHHKKGEEGGESSLGNSAQHRFEDFGNGGTGDWRHGDGMNSSRVHRRSSLLDGSIAAIGRNLVSSCQSNK